MSSPNKECHIEKIVNELNHLRKELEEQKWKADYYKDLWSKERDRNHELIYLKQEEEEEKDDKEELKKEKRSTIKEDFSSKTDQDLYQDNFQKFYSSIAQRRKLLRKPKKQYITLTKEELLKSHQELDKKFKIMKEKFFSRKLSSSTGGNVFNRGKHYSKQRKQQKNAKKKERNFEISRSISPPTFSPSHKIITTKSTATTTKTTSATTATEVCNNDLKNHPKHNNNNISPTNISFSPYSIISPIKPPSTNSSSLKTFLNSAPSPEASSTLNGPKNAYASESGLKLKFEKDINSLNEAISKMKEYRNKQNISSSMLETNTCLEKQELKIEKNTQFELSKQVSKNRETIKCFELSKTYLEIHEKIDDTTIIKTEKKIQEKDLSLIIKTEKKIQEKDLSLEEKNEIINKIETAIDGWAKNKSLRLLLNKIFDHPYRESGYLGPNVSWGVLRKSYHQAVSKVHPDRHINSDFETMYRNQKLFLVLQRSYEKYRKKYQKKKEELLSSSQ